MCVKPFFLVYQFHPKHMMNFLYLLAIFRFGICNHSVASSLGLNQNLISFLHSKDFIPGISEVKKAIPDIENDMLSAKVISKKSKVVVNNNDITAESKTKVKEDSGKKELTSVTKQKIISNVSKYDVSGKVRDDQNDELNRKVRKAKTRPVNKDLCNSTRTKAETGIANDEFMAKVIDHHWRGELRVLTVADLKCFLGARKAKVGGTKEVLVQRVTELLDDRCVMY